MSEVTGRTAKVVARVLTLASDLNQNGDNLKREVDEFLTGVRAA